ncbi:hypothetical protein TWF106_002955 [Orbilia oligospora]|uniref:Peptidase C14 caspase domain-containing protein n=1 Tax=Orbilia oligospora TaxID=2813651 RepID=A0A7C8QSE9_ORBOL|nr:hypothetical protein TWF106_002955 [Orbilia oligospora]
MASKPEIWGLLVGVNHYLPGNKRRVKYGDLSGCVKDVMALQNYLEKRNVRHITTLTSTKGCNGRPEEDESQLPTHPNIIRELERVIEDSRPGDLVYFHYSGHGIRRDADEIGADEGDHISGTALALADVMEGGAYLTGYQLGVYIKRMVFEKKLRVTVVLDSCFSGRGFRDAESEEEGYTSRRGDDCIDLEFLQSDQEAEDAARLLDEDEDQYIDGTRNGMTIRSWLSDPTGCTVLTACESNETAGEYTFEGEKHGILTYWMLKLLSENPETCRPSYNKVRDYIANNIDRAHSAKKQSPVLLGDTDHVFLGQEQVVEKPVGHVWERRLNTNTVELDIGWANGVVRGAIYDVFLEKDNVTTGSISKVKAQVTEVPDNHPFRSKAILQYAPEDSSTAAQVKPGSVVILQSWSLHLDAFVDISSLRQHLSEDQIEGLGSHIRQTPGLFLGSDVEKPENQECDFQVTLNQDNCFEVLLFEIGNGKYTTIPRVTPIPFSGSDWDFKLAYILRHLARFRDVRSIDSKRIDAPLNPEWFSFSVEPDDEGYGDDFEKDPEDPTALRASEDTNLRFSFKMNNDCKYQSVFVSFYDFDASWGISKLEPGPGQVHEVTKQTPVHFTIQMMIPEKCTPQDPEEIIDTVRVFISTTRTNWEDITLPELPSHACTVPPVIVTVPSDDPDAETKERGPEVSQSLFDLSSAEDDDKSDSRNPKRKPAVRRTPPSPPRNVWGFMDLKVTTFPKN